MYKRRRGIAKAFLAEYSRLHGLLRTVNMSLGYL
jgi:hypothetical protein